MEIFCVEQNCIYMKVYIYEGIYRKVIPYKYMSNPTSNGVYTQVVQMVYRLFPHIWIRKNVVIMSKLMTNLTMGIRQFRVTNFVQEFQKGFFGTFTKQYKYYFLIAYKHV